MPHSRFLVSSKPTQKAKMIFIEDNHENSKTAATSSKNEVHFSDTQTFDDLLESKLQVTPRIMKMGFEM
ncbi:hypothetical protein BOTNAR_0053g00300 [Botryotinia narcissicola]|uniref:Uncharacterized protein n=1 Tax=Botryotinia narcissicola TaxID=278944 RepID=A0A4Z1JD15_9HELO|nr:hypothetical protein BOTNAR_0053g00300 [Botryotinia narcissicola]